MGTEVEISKAIQVTACSSSKPLEMFRRTDLATHYDAERTTITRNGKTVAAIVALEDLETTDALKDLMDWKAAHKRPADSRKCGGKTLEAVRIES